MADVAFQDNYTKSLRAMGVNMNAYRDANGAVYYGEKPRNSTQSNVDSRVTRLTGEARPVTESGVDEQGRDARAEAERKAREAEEARRRLDSQAADGGGNAPGSLAEGLESGAIPGANEPGGWTDFSTMETSQYAEHMKSLTSMNQLANNLKGTMLGAGLKAAVNNEIESVQRGMTGGHQVNENDDGTFSVSMSTQTGVENVAPDVFAALSGKGKYGKDLKSFQETNPAPEVDPDFSPNADGSPSADTSSAAAASASGQQAGQAGASHGSHSSGQAAEAAAASVGEWSGGSGGNASGSGSSDAAPSADPGVYGGSQYAHGGEVKGYAEGGDVTGGGLTGLEGLGVPAPEQGSGQPPAQSVTQGAGPVADDVSAQPEAGSMVMNASIVRLKGEKFFRGEVDKFNKENPEQVSGTGPGEEKVHIKVSNGEIIFSPQFVAWYGKRHLNKLNAEGVEADPATAQKKQEADQQQAQQTASVNPPPVQASDEQPGIMGPVATLQGIDAKSRTSPQVPKGPMSGLSGLA